MGYIMNAANKIGPSPIIMEMKNEPKHMNFAYFIN